MFDLIVLYALGHVGSDKEHPFIAAGVFALFETLMALVPFLTGAAGEETDMAQAALVIGVVAVWAFGFSAVLFHLLTVWAEDLGKWITTMIIGLFLWFTLPFAIMQQVENFM